MAPLKQDGKETVKKSGGLYSTRPKRGPIEAGSAFVVPIGRVLYSTRPKRGPIEASIYLGKIRASKRIPRVLSVAPLKLRF